MLTNNDQRKPTAIRRLGRRVNTWKPTAAKIPFVPPDSQTMIHSVKNNAEAREKNARYLKCFLLMDSRDKPVVGTKIVPKNEKNKGTVKQV